MASRPAFGRCELRNFDDGGIPCSGQGQHSHHVLARQLFRGCPAAMKYADKNAHVLQAQVCVPHNTYRTGDTRRGRAYLLFLKCVEHGRAEVERVLDGIPWKVKQPDMTLAALVSGTDYESMIDDLSQAP